MQTPSRRVALVTGANRGIGFAIAGRLAHAGLTVIMGCRNESRGNAACERLSGQGLDAHFTLLDVTDATTVQSAVARTADRFGRLDVLVNNAGIMIDSHTGILELDTALLQNTLETNAYGPLLLSQACIPVMRRHAYGRIVNLSSTLGSLTDTVNPDSSLAEVGSPAYRMSKTLLNAITALLARELRGSNILVNSVCPGWVRTDLGGPRAPLSPDQAAATPFWLATLPDDGPTGGFFREHQPIPW
jgi:NAD(P)-dependent dehydrogenase (short-subunit alcohol dehydrogenase family)